MNAYQMRSWSQLLGHGCQMHFFPQPTSSEHETSNCATKTENCAELGNIVGVSWQAQKQSSFSDLRKYKYLNTSVCWWATKWQIQCTRIVNHWTTIAQHFRSNIKTRETCSSELTVLSKLRRECIFLSVVNPQPFPDHSFLLISSSAFWDAFPTSYILLLSETSCKSHWLIWFPQKK